MLKIDDGIRKQGMSVGTDGGISQLDGGRNGTSSGKLQNERT